MSDFGNRLKNLRTKLRYTQEEVAVALFVSKQVVSRWENNDCMPDIETLNKLAEFFNVSVDFLLAGNNNVEIEKEIEIVEKEETVEDDRILEEPLSREMLRIILMHYQRLHLAYVGCFLLGIVFLIAGIGLMIFCHDEPSLIAFPILFMIEGVVGIIGGFYNRKKYLIGKSEIEQKMGRKVGFFNFKDKE